MRLTNGEVLLSWPVEDHRITAGWLYSDGSAHSALDLGVPTGTPVTAAESGTVDLVQHWDGVSTKGNQSYGTMLRLRHEPYQGGVLQTRYAHLSRLCVDVGDRVGEGQIIGYAGSTGNSTGPHLHFEVLYRGGRCNPLNWLDDDFYKACAAVILGSYQSVPRPGAAADKPALVTLQVGPMSSGDRARLEALAASLGLPCAAV